MRRSFTSLICPRWTIDRLAAAGGQWHYQGVELRCDARHAHGAEVYAEAADLRRIARRLDEEGLVVSCLTTSLQLGDPGFMDHLPERVRLAAAIGAPAVRVFAGARWEDWDLESYRTTIADRLREAAILAEGEDVEVWLQTHGSCATAAETAELARRSAHPRVGVVWDIAQTFLAGEKPAIARRTLGDLLKHVHFHDAVRTADGLMLTRLGDGQIPLRETLTVLAETGFTGHLCAQWFDDLYGPNPDDALEAFQREVQAAPTPLTR